MTVPGLYIGLGEECRGNFAGRVFQAVLVNPAVDGESYKLRLVPAKDGSRDPYVSYEEPLSKPGYVLNHSRGKMIFSNAPVYNNRACKQGSSWRMTSVESVEEKAMKLPTTCVEKSNLLDEECPCCFEPYASKKIQFLNAVCHFRVANGYVG